MRIAKTFYARWMFFVTVAVLLGLLSVSPVRMEAQTGYNAIYNASSACCSPSNAFIDASVFCTGGSCTGNDLCAVVNKALQALPSTGGVVDARGVLTSTGKITCAAGTTPWLQSGVFTTTPSEILLPPDFIYIQAPWILPDRTRIFGDGALGTNGTYIWAAEGSEGTFTGTAMIYMGYNGTPTGYPSAPCPNSNICTGVSVENLTLNAQQQASSGTEIGGIVNTNSEALSYVNQIAFADVFGANLQVSAPNSGPYTDLTFTACIGNPGSGNCPNGTIASTSCVQLQNNTGGFHGFTCIGGAGTSYPAPAGGVEVNAASNSVEDIHFEGIQDGVLIGNTENAEANVVFNVEGSTTSSGDVNNVIHICGPKSASGGNCPTTTQVEDIGLFGLASGGLTPRPNTVLDDVTGTTLSNPGISSNDTDQNVGMYVLGELVAGSSSSGSAEYSRFTTSPRIPTWGAGNNVPGSSCSTGSPGSLYSNTGATFGGGANTVFVCVGTSWVAIK
jgi:hypothetical protein